MIVALNIVNIIFVPLEIAFDVQYKTNPAYMAVGAFFSIIFLLDIFLNLRTTYTNVASEEIDDPVLVAKRYIPTVGFVFDVLSILQLNYIFNNNDLKFIIILRCINIGRLDKIITHLTFKEDVKALMKFFYYILLLVLYIHFVACCWHRVLIINDVWIPPLDYVDYKASIFFSTDDIVY